MMENLKYLLESLFRDGGAAELSLQVASAFVLLFAGWLAALLITGALKSALKKMELGRRLARFLPEDAASAGKNIEIWIPRILYYLLLLLVLLLFLNSLGLSGAADPINTLLTKIAAYGANLIGAVILFALAWLLATMLRYLSASAMTALRVDERFDACFGMKNSSGETGDSIDFMETDAENSNRISPSSVIAECIYWLIFLCFLPGILGVLKLNGILEPFLKMAEKTLQFLPNLAAGILVFIAGLFAAKTVRRVIGNLLFIGRIDRLMNNAGLGGAFGKNGFSEIAGILGYILVLLPTMAISMDALGIDALSFPLRNLLDRLLSAGANLFGAAVLLFVVYLTGYLLSSMLTRFLENAGFNGLFRIFGLSEEKLNSSKTGPSVLAGKLFLFILMLLAFSGSCDLLGFRHAAETAADLLPFLGKLVFGVILFLSGSVLANIVYGALSVRPSASSTLTAMAARIGILFFSGALALNAMGIANEVIMIAFALILGAFSVAFALAFGLGGREVASEKLREWQKLFEKDSRQK